jgi:hypothetical protein
LKHLPKGANKTIHQQLLKFLRNNKNIVILSADKGLGPFGVSLNKYREWGMRHLNNASTYSIINKEEALLAANNLYKQIYQWTQTYQHDLGENTTLYIRDKIEHSREDPFGSFYLLAKLHKTPISTWPVCSDCASLPHSVSKWIDCQLQPIIQTQHTYFKNSTELKQLLESMDTLPANACLFTYDAVSMYTNIDTQHCIHCLSEYPLKDTTSENFPHIKSPALIEALHIVKQ